MSKLLKKRFDELTEQAEKVEATKRKGRAGLYGESFADYVQ